MGLYNVTCMPKPKLIGVTNATATGRDGSSLIVIIPRKVVKRLKIVDKQEFKVLIDYRGRIIYDKI